METSPADARAVTPKHLWIVGVLALLWNAFGGFDYLATQLNFESYMAQFTPEQRAYFESFPAWTVAAWAVGVWCAILGSLALLLRSSWAVWLFGASLVGLIVSSVYNYTSESGRMMMMEGGGMVMNIVIWVVAIALYVYALQMGRRGVLR
jgi:hypothetical protein